MSTKKSNKNHNISCVYCDKLQDHEAILSDLGKETTRMKNIMIEMGKMLISGGKEDAEQKNVYYAGGKSRNDGNKCYYCDKGFPLDSTNTVHLPSQRLGMINITYCRNAIDAPTNQTQEEEQCLFCKMIPPLRNSSFCCKEHEDKWYEKQNDIPPNCKYDSAFKNGKGTTLFVLQRDGLGKDPKRIEMSVVDFQNNGSQTTQTTTTRYFSVSDGKYEEFCKALGKLQLGDQICVIANKKVKS